MQKEKPRLARLAAILTQLQAKSLVTASSIAEKHDVSIRTVYRDIRTLEQSGIPIMTIEGKGYSIMEGYTLPPVMFTEAEANALITAAHIINKDKDASLKAQYNQVIEKITSVLQFSQKEKSELLSERIQIRNNPGNETTSNYLIQLQTTITNRQVVKLYYRSLVGKDSSRHIEPFALYSTQGNWILIAFCRLRKEFRAFRLDCIKSMMVLGEHFEAHDMTLEDYFEVCRANRIAN
ncbi:MAG: helix-turn-helix transcriptional regulator [Bacteroidia bacterium]